MKPIFRIVVNGDDITGKINKNLMGITLTDKRNLEADQLDIVFADPLGNISLPPKGVDIQCWLGFSHAAGTGGGLVYKGAFTADEIAHDGPPDKITVRARSANFSQGLKQQRDKSFDGKSIGDILAHIAQTTGLDLAVERRLKETVIDHLDQTNESFANLLSRLADRYDAVATVKDNHLLFIPAGHGETVSGIALPRLVIDRSETSNHRYTDASRDSDFTGVRSRWHDLNTGRDHFVLVGATGNVKTLRQTWPTEREARDSAAAEWRRLSRAEKTMFIACPAARLDLAPNSPVSLTGWKPEITAVKWVAGDVTHALGGGGLTTKINLESLPD